MNNVVVALAVSGSDLYVGGGFTTAGGSAATNIAKWNGSRWAALRSGEGGGVVGLADSCKEIDAGGGFETAGGSEGNHIAQMDGSRWGGRGCVCAGGVGQRTICGRLVHDGGRQ